MGFVKNSTFLEYIKSAMKTFLPVKGGKIVGNLNIDGKLEVNGGLDINSETQLDLINTNRIDIRSTKQTVNIGAEKELSLTSSLGGISLTTYGDISLMGNTVTINDIDIEAALKPTPTAINDNFSYVPITCNDGVTRYMLVANSVEALTNLVSA